MMKKLIQILLLGTLLASCSSLPNIKIPQLLASPTSPPSLPTQTPFPSKTPIPTQNLFATSTSTPLTFTPTVTQIGAELFTPTGTATDFPSPVPGVLPPAVVNGNLFTPVNVGFLT